MCTRRKVACSPLLHRGQQGSQTMDLRLVALALCPVLQGLLLQPVCNGDITVEWQSGWGEALTGGAGPPELHCWQYRQSLYCSATFWPGERGQRSHIYYTPHSINSQSWHRHLSQPWPCPPAHHPSHHITTTHHIITSPPHTSHITASPHISHITTPPHLHLLELQLELYGFTWVMACASCTCEVSSLSCTSSS